MNQIHIPAASLQESSNGVCLTNGRLNLAAEEIFTHWKTCLDHPAARLTPERKTKIAARLRDGYTVEQIKRAVDGCVASPFHRGDNEQRTPYDDLTLICRNGEKLEKFLLLADRTPALLRPAPRSHDHGRAQPSVEATLRDYELGRRAEDWAAQALAALPADEYTARLATLEQSTSTDPRYANIRWADDDVKRTHFEALLKRELLEATTQPTERNR